MKRLQIPNNLCAQNFTYTKKFSTHEIAAVDLSKIFFLKNAKKTCKPRLNYNHLHKNIRSSHPEMFCEKGVLKNFAKFTEKTFAREPL